MPKYGVVGVIKVSVYTEVEAENEEAAKQIAMDRGIQGICGRCASVRYSDEKADTTWRLSDGLGEGDVRITDVEEM